MQIFIDIDVRQPLASPGDREPMPTISVTTQDTLELDVYFVRGGQFIDPGVGVTLKFGVFPSPPSTTSTPVALLTSFARTQDSGGNYYWQGLLNFNTTQMVAAVTGHQTPVQCVSEFRYALPDGELIHTLFTQFSIFPTLLQETGVPPVNVQTTYPDVAAIELVAHKGVANGYAALDGSSLVPVGELPIDANTIVASAGKLTVPIDSVSLIVSGGKVAVAVDGQTIIAGSNGLQLAAVLSAFTAGWTTVNPGIDTATLAIADTTKLVGGSTVRIPGAGYYVVKTIVNPTHAILTNNRDTINAAAGTSIASGTVILPAQNVGDGTGSGGSGSATLADAETTFGLTLLGSTAGTIKRLVGGNGIALDPNLTTGAITISLAASAGPGIEMIAHKDIASGYAGLDSGGWIKNNEILTDSSLAVRGAQAQLSVNLTDDETTTGKSLIGTSYPGTIKRLIGGVGITLDDVTTPGGMIVNGASSAGLNWRGNWSSSVAYALNDVVERLGSSYVATLASTNKDPSTNPVASPTAGHATVGTTYTNQGGILAQAVTPSATGVVASISFYGGFASAAVVMGIYADASGQPGALLAQTAIGAVINGFNTLPLTTSLTLVAGTPYWVAMLSSNVVYEYYDYPVPANSYRYTGQLWNAGTMPSTFPVSSATLATNQQYTMYATLNVSYWALLGAGISADSGNALLRGSDSLMYVGSTGGAGNVNWRGNWSGSASYLVNDAAERNGVAFIAVANNTNIDPLTEPNPLTFGTTNPAGSTGPTSPQGLICFQITPTRTSTLVSISLYVVTARFNAAFGIYSDSGGVPGTLLAQNATSLTLVNGWNTLTIPGNVVLTAGTNYWLAILTGFTSPNVSDLTTLPGPQKTVVVSTQAWNSGIMPSTCPAGTASTTWNFAFYASVLSVPVWTGFGAALSKDPGNEITRGSDNLLFAPPTGNSLWSGIEKATTFDETNLENTNFVTGTFGTGSFTLTDGYGRNATSKVLGSITLITGTATTGGYCNLAYNAITPAVDLYTNGLGPVTFIARLALQSLAVNTSTDFPWIAFGWADGTNSPTNGPYFSYPVGGVANWTCTMQDYSNSDVHTNSGVAVDTAFHRFKITISADWKTYTYYIDDVQVAQTVRGITPTFPSPVVLRPQLLCQKYTSTATNYKLTIDWVYWKYSFTN